jgi:predicted nucleic acid-binding protein
MFLPDINVWLALAFDRHSHHAAAIAWYGNSNEPCSFCRWTQQGFLRQIHITVPAHCPVKRSTLSHILKDGEVSVDDFLAAL